MKKILIIEDDPYIGNMLSELLGKEGYDVCRAYSGTEALLILSKTTPDLILLDLMLPGRSGEELLPQIKEFPIIILSAKTDVNHKADLLLEGAVDYITKPFHTKELLARIAVQLRKPLFNHTPSNLTFEELTLDLHTHIVSSGEHQIKLTRTEFAILKLLMQNSTQVMTKSLLLDQISQDTPDCTESSLKIHICNLRKKLREINEKDYIESVWGIGFKLRQSQF